MLRTTCAVFGGASSFSAAFPRICVAIQRRVCGSVRSCTSVYTPSRRSAHSLSCSHLQGLMDMVLRRRVIFNTPRHGPSGPRRGPSDPRQPVALTLAPLPWLMQEPCRGSRRETATWGDSGVKRSEVGYPNTLPPCRKGGRARHFIAQRTPAVRAAAR